MKLIYSRDNKFNTSTPILFLTHKEYMVLTGYCTWRPIRKIIFFHEFLFLKINSIFFKLFIYFFNNSFLKSVKIVHWGVTLKTALPNFKKFADVHLSDETTAKFNNNKYGYQLVHPFTSKDFEPINSYNEYSKSSFKWDLITVSHNSKRKCLDDTLYIIRKCLDLNSSLTALLIVNTPSKDYRSNNSISSVNFINLYFSLFNYSERQQIVLLRISDEMKLEGVSPSYVKWSMYNSRIFLFSSKKEGSAKVIREAYNSNCLIVAREGLTGGSYDHINKNKLFTWSNRDSAVEIISKLINNLKSRTPIVSEPFINIDAVIKLENFLKSRNLIPNNESLSSSDFAYANRWLPAHLHDHLTKKITADITSPIQFLRFLRKNY